MSDMTQEQIDAKRDEKYAAHESKREKYYADLRAAEMRWYAK